MAVMPSRVALLAITLMAGIARIGKAQEVLPSDVAIQLAAEPSTDIIPGQPIAMTVTVSNSGALPIDVVSFDSSEIYPDQLDISQAYPDCEMVVYVGDTTTGYFYVLSWPIGLGNNPSLGPYEIRTCSFTMRLADAAQGSVPFRFSMSGLYADSNPSNDSSSVTLTRMVGAPPAAVPAVSLFGLVGLALLLMFVALVRHGDLGNKGRRNYPFETRRAANEFA